MNSNEPRPPWPHAPVHQLGKAGTYMVTSGTYQKEHFFRKAASLEHLQDRLIQLLGDSGWHLEAWAIFSNHYHFIAHSPDNAETGNSLGDVIHRLHNRSAQWINERDNAPSRKVWHNYWETRLTFHNSYLTRLQYVHQNAVKHGLVMKASLYPWCSAGWVEGTTSPAMLKSLARFYTDKIKVEDGFDPLTPTE